jgi:hypothetical protein
MKEGCGRVRKTETDQPGPPSQATPRTWARAWPTSSGAALRQGALHQHKSVANVLFGRLKRPQRLLGELKVDGP